ncbi:hypothetical protein Tco_1486066, partial [Tanacetum coccineum]
SQKFLQKQKKTQVLSPTNGTLKKKKSAKNNNLHTMGRIKSHAIDVTILDIMLMNVQTNTKIKEITHHTRNHLHQRFQTKKIQAAATQVMTLPSSLEKTSQDLKAYDLREVTVGK